VTRHTGIGVALAALAAIGWVVLAIRTPTNTYHFAPLVVALAAPIAARSDPARSDPARSDLGGPDLGGSESPWSRLVVGCVGGVVAAAIGLSLAASGNLEGPTFWGEGGALGEVLLFSIGGAVAGGVLMWRRPAP
jgi:hypothetical protein